MLVVLLAGTLHAQETGGSNTQELLDRIDELEKRLRRLDDESKARKKLEITEEERLQREKEVLDTVGSEYMLDPQRTLSIDYSFNYAYQPSELLTKDDAFTLDRNVDHTMTHTIGVGYSVLDNLSASMSLPFVYRYNRVGTEDELDETDIGDMSFGVGIEPWKTDESAIRTTFSFSAGLPTGRSRFKINPEHELSTGSGVYSVGASANFSKQVDPVVLFWKVGYSHAFPLDNLDYRVAEGVTLEEYNPGDSISIGGGLAWAMSYVVSINMSFSYGYSLSSKYTYNTYTQESGDSAGASFGLGMGYRISPKTTLSFSLGYGLTGSGFSLGFRAPFSFVL